MNQLIEGQIKIGITTKNSSKETAQLSKVTGLATPFILVYQMAVRNCTKAKMFIETVLKRKGYQVVNNEFFIAPLDEVIRVFMVYNIEFGNEYEDETCKECCRIELLAIDYYYGLEVAQDYAEALKLYEQSAILGSLFSFAQLGEMYQKGQGCTQDFDIAISYCEEGLDYGANQCNAILEEIYCALGDQDTAQKYREQYLEKINQDNSLTKTERFYGYLANTHKYNEKMQQLEIIKRRNNKRWRRTTSVQDVWKAFSYFRNTFSATAIVNKTVTARESVLISTLAILVITVGLF